MKKIKCYNTLETRNKKGKKNEEEFTFMNSSCFELKFKKSMTCNVLMILFLTGTIFTIQESFAAPSIEWRLNGASVASMDYSEGNLANGDPVTIFVMDDNPALSGNGLDTIQIVITTSKETITVSLPEDVADNGEFETNIIFMKNDNRFVISDSVTIQVEDDDFANNDILDTIDVGNGDKGVFVFSDTEVGNGNDGIEFGLFTETNPNSGIFNSNTKLKFSTAASNEPIGILLVSLGDFLTFEDLQTNAITNAIITPLTLGKAAIIAEQSTTITATYNDGTTDFSDNLDLLDDNPGGRGSGGAARPGLVVDSKDGVGNNRLEPPTIGKNLDGTKQIVTNGFCIDIDCFTVIKLFHEEFKLYEMMSGTHTLRTLVYCAQGVQNCNYSAIGIMPYDKDMNDALWKIEMKKQLLDEWTPVIFDPLGFLGDVTVTVQVVNDKLLQTSYTIQFKNKETPPMKVGVQVRDYNNGVRNFYFNDGIKFQDAHAYPYVETTFEKPLEVESLCLNENPNNRNSCAFKMVQAWATKNAEDTLNDILNNNYVFDDY